MDTETQNKPQVKVQGYIPIGNGARNSGQLLTSATQLVSTWVHASRNANLLPRLMQIIIATGEHSCAKPTLIGRPTSKRISSVFVFDFRLVEQLDTVEDNGQELLQIIYLYASVWCAKISLDHIGIEIDSIDQYLTKHSDRFRKIVFG